MSRPLRVLLLAGVEPHVGLSIQQFIRALQSGFDGSRDIELQTVGLTELGFGRSLGRDPQGLRLPARLENLADSFIRYPATALWAGRAGRRPDVFHIADQWYGHLAWALPGRRTVISCHDLILAKYDGLGGAYRPNPREQKRFDVSTSTLASVARVVCSSEATRDDLVTLRGVSPERIDLVPKGLGRHLRPIDERAELPHAGRRRLLHVSTGMPYKNVPTTLRVLAELRGRGNDVALLRVGVPLDAGEAELARDLGVAEFVAELGKVSDDALTRIYNSTDVLLFPSLREGFGRPPLEAMACGLPVVVSDAEPFPEVLGDAALSAGALDVAGLADAVAAVLSEPALRATLRARGLTRARVYSWEAMVERYARIYTDVAGAA